MAKSALIVLSSPRKKSNSSALAQAIGKGFKNAGGKVEVVDLAKLNVSPCVACELCQKKPGHCSLKDDMPGLFPKIIAAEAVVLASPVYWFNLSAQIKAFLDRCFAVAAHPDGPFSQKTFAAALAYGDVDPLASGGVNAIRSLQDMCGYTGAKWAGCVYGSAMEKGLLAKNEDLLNQAFNLGLALAE